MSPAHKLSLLFALYFCQGLPGGFVAKALKVLLREQGQDLTTIGFAGLLSLPWTAKVVWAPLVDRVYVARWGRRRSWLLPTQAAMIAVTLAFVLVRPEDGLVPVAALFVVLNVLAATQDVAVDGTAVDVLDDDEVGPGNAAQVGGFKLGNLVGGGVLVATMTTIGWTATFLVMAGCLLVAWLMVLTWREPPPPDEVGRATVGEGLRRLWAALRGQGLAFWAFLAWVKFGETFGGDLADVMLLDRGWSWARIGTIDGVLGSVATIAGALVGGAVVRRLGWARALGLCAAGQGAALVAVGVYASGEVTVGGYAAIVVLEKGFGGGVAVAVFALAMSWRDRAVGAAQFTAAQVVYMGGAALAAPLAGAVADRVGYSAVMIAGGAMAGSVLLILRLGGARRLSPPA